MQAFATIAVRTTTKAKPFRRLTCVTRARVYETKSRGLGAWIATCPTNAKGIATTARPSIPQRPDSWTTMALALPVTVVLKTRVCSMIAVGWCSVLGCVPVSRSLDYPS